jgi:hypothetical protein
MALTYAGPVEGVAIGLPGGNQVAYGVTAAAIIKSTPGIACRVICLGAGSISMYDANVTNSTTNATTTNAISSTNQFYSNSTMTLGQTIELLVPCATGIAVSVGAGTFAIPFA